MARTKVRVKSQAGQHPDHKILMRMEGMLGFTLVDVGRLQNMWISPKDVQQGMEKVRLDILNDMDRYYQQGLMCHPNDTDVVLGVGTTHLAIRGWFYTRTKGYTFTFDPLNGNGVRIEAIK
jgi:hypothetical protein